MTDVAALDQSCIWSPEMDKAAAQVLRKLPPGNREYAGAIYARTGPLGLLEYCYSLPVKGTGDNFAFKAEKGQKLAAIWHSHPEGEDSDHFSPNDVKTAEALGKPSYILDQGADKIRRYDPGISPTKKAPRNGRLEAGAKVSLGGIVDEAQEAIRMLVAGQ